MSPAGENVLNIDSSNMQKERAMVLISIYIQTTVVSKDENL